MGTTQTGTGTLDTGSIRLRLRQLRRIEIGRSEKWLAEQVGVSPSHLKRVLDGERGLAGDLAERIERVLSQEEAE